MKNAKSLTSLVSWENKDANATFLLALSHRSNKIKNIKTAAYASYTGRMKTYFVVKYKY